MLVIRLAVVLLVALFCFSVSPVSAVSFKNAWEKTKEAASGTADSLGGLGKKAVKNAKPASRKAVKNTKETGKKIVEGSKRSYKKIKGDDEDEE